MCSDVEAMEPSNCPTELKLGDSNCPTEHKLLRHGLLVFFFFPSSRLFRLLILDVKQKALWFWSNFWHGLSLQCLAPFLFPYCACMSLDGGLELVPLHTHARGRGGHCSLIWASLFLLSGFSFGQAVRASAFSSCSPWPQTPVWGPLRRKPSPSPGSSEMGSCSFLPSCLPFLGRVFIWPWWL